MKHVLSTSICALSLAVSFGIQAETFQLTGQDLTVDQLWEAAAKGNDVTLSRAAWKRVEDSYQTTIDAAKKGIEIYGLTTNFGDLKDQEVVKGDIEAEPNRTKSIEFNKRQLRIQAAAMEPYFEDRIVKMGMIIRLNQMAAGLTGMTTETAKYYQTFINNDVIPMVPGRGSPGVNDLNWATHIGLAMIGEWDVHYKGKKVPATKAMADLGIKPLEPFGLDGISILSNSNISMAITVEAIQQSQHLLDISPYIVATSLECLNGNVSPFLWHSIEGKGMPQGHVAAEPILKALEGSFLWQPNEERYLQDPLTFRSSHWTLAAAHEELDQLRDLVEKQLNHTSDNPMVTIEGRTDMWYSDTPVVKSLMVDPKKGSYVNSNSAFDNTQIAIQVESLATAMAHVIHNSGWRSLQVGMDHRTHLPKYLVAKSNKGGDGFANIIQAISGYYAEAAGLTNNVTLYGLPTSNIIEETYNNVNVTAERLKQMNDIAYEVFSYEILHMTQGAQMRRDEQGYKLGKGTSALLKEYRKVVPFVDKDRPFTKDVNNGVKFLKQLDVTTLL
ncbi:aromatic amino acid ammonia-lyase [Ferrimonas sp. YFM]|uniref:aromatic amino acid ammonia-lyase n=1 Tax=Ferrimonas sp. YFM TaxID=3028878 RepID=UPI0025743067|nr:aromatic amino acid ammonia-lyase [Ferrimonas sp. YFM]BDY06087.1 phenylalanine ammonia-lyase [Ferrimonas sp. YFM]